MPIRDMVMLATGCVIGSLFSYFADSFTPNLGGLTSTLWYPSMKSSTPKTRGSNRPFVGEHGANETGIQSHVSSKHSRENCVDCLFPLPHHWCPHGPSTGMIAANLQKIQPGQLVVDAGAYDGQDAIDWAKAGHKIISIEATPQKAAAIKKKIHESGVEDNITFLSLAVSNATGETQFNSWQYSGHDQIGGAPYKGTMVTQTVKVDTLDNIVGDQDVFLMKIDTQGHDHVVIQGARRLLSSGRVAILIFEVSPRLTDEWREIGNAFRFLNRHGYTCFDCEGFSRTNIGFPKHRMPYSGGAMNVDLWLEVLHGTYKSIRNANAGLEMNVACFYTGGAMR